MDGQSKTSSSEAAHTDSFVRAADALASQRPLRNARLQKIAADLSANRIEGAEKALNDHLAKRPSDADALHLMAGVRLRQGRRSDAVALWERGLALAPDFAAARFNLAKLLYRLGDFDAAQTHAAQLLAADNANLLFRQLQADLSLAMGDGPRAVILYEQLAAETPGRAESWIAYGNAARALGRSGDSIAAYRKALALRPSSGTVFWALANMKTVRFSDSEIDAMEALVKGASTPADDRGLLHFALGKAYEDQRAYKRSFEHYARANAAARARFPYNAESVSKAVAEYRALYTPVFLASRATVGNKTRDPIFVASLPRSGSTLVEQILASHSAIEGTDELPYIPAMAQRLMAGSPSNSSEAEAVAALDPASFEAFGGEYLRSAQRHRKTAKPFFVDKKPPNFFHAGLIHLILPNARIIDVRRHPAACCLSMFKQHFQIGRPRPNLTELGRLYRDYVALMAHFDSVLPGRVHRVIYEELIADPEREVRRLLDYLELPFEESCLRFYENKRAVLTPSSEQVRQPISGEAVDHWRHYEAWLGPLIQSLGSVYTDYPAVPPGLR